MVIIKKRRYLWVYIVLTASILSFQPRLFADTLGSEDLERVPHPVRAEPTEKIDAPSDQEVIQRIVFLENSFNDTQTVARLWAASWMAVFSGLTIYNVLGIANGSRKWDEDLTYFTVGAVKSGLAFGMMLIGPFPSADAGARFEKIPDATAAQRLSKLRKGERLLQQGSEKVLGDRTFFQHALKIGANLVGGAIIWGVEGRDGWKHALVSTGVGTALAVGSIWTMPMKPVKSYRRYREKYLNNQMSTIASPPREIVFFVVPVGRGITAGVLF
ncbi:MAG: hypothetical protein QNJ97_23840 [Myxococcota bacterium]|nr:hypothetical protein [Myxococcota bacterium]